MRRAGLESLSLFNGEITADSVSGRAQATATQKSSSGDLAGTGFANLTVFGQLVPEPAPNQRLDLADWGYVIMLEQPQASASGKQGYHGYAIALDLHLTAEHAGLPAGTEIQVGYADVTRSRLVRRRPALRRSRSARACPCRARRESGRSRRSRRTNGIPPVHPPDRRT